MEDLSRRVERLEKRFTEEQGMFASDHERDRYIVLLFTIVLLYIGYQWYEMQEKKEGLDNRPRWMMGGLLDGLGETNPSWLGKGYGVDETGKGKAQTMDDQYQVAYGQVAYKDHGKIQTEYGETLSGARSNFALPAKPLPDFLRKEPLDAKSRLDNRKEHMQAKTTDEALRKQLA